MNEELEKEVVGTQRHRGTCPPQALFLMILGGIVGGILAALFLMLFQGLVSLVFGAVGGRKARNYAFILNLLFIPFLSSLGGLLHGGLRLPASTARIVTRLWSTC